MASVNIYIEIDNSAFTEGQAPEEIKRIVAKIPFYQNADDDDILKIEGSDVLRDYNGNTIGYVEISE